MIKFGKISARNFLSIGDAPFEIDLSETRSTLVVGKNGCGKSTMLDILSFVLFGKPHRKINKPQLINSINNKNCLATCEFTLGKSKYKIVRGLKPNIFEIWCNGKMINQESHSRDYQKLLETNILKLNHKSFHQVVVLGSSNFTPFMQLSTWVRREVIEELLDIGVFSQMNTVLKDKLARLKDSLSESEMSLDSIKDKINLFIKHITALEKIDQNNSQKITEEIQEIQECIDALVAINAQTSDKITDLLELEADPDQLDSAITNLNQYKFRIEDNISTKRKTQVFYETNDNCPTCSQAIHFGVKQEKIVECTHSLSELTAGLDKINTEITTRAATLSKIKTQLETIKSLRNTIAGNNRSIDDYSARIMKLESESKVPNQPQKIQIQEANQNLSELKADKKKTLGTRNKLIEDRRYYDAALELLKDSGIKTKIIKQYLPLMNKLINHYLQILDFYVSFELDENFNETLRSRHRDDFSYASFSEGEKSRIDLALLFAWREVSRMKNSASTNLLVLDEVFDSSLDIDGVDNLVKIMDSIQADTRVFVITHKPDSFESLFDRKVTVEKDGNFSKYSLESLK